MKKCWLMISLAILIFFSLHAQIAADEQTEQKNVVKQHVSKNDEYPFKKPVKWEIALVDARTNERQDVLLNAFGYNPGTARLDERMLAMLAAQLARNIDRPLINPTITLDGQIVPGQSRVILSEKELVDKLQQITFHDKEVTLPIYETLPTVTKEQLQGISEVKLGEFTTYFNPKVEGRSNNIQLSSKALQHYVIGPGEEFSFNKVVGERTVEKGYKEAKEIVNKEFIVGIGGGICQTSSTLFNAIDAAGLKVVERFSHSRDVGYIPPNRDATVSWGGPDFKFINPYSQPVLIRTDVSLETGELTVSVFSSQSKDNLIASR